MNENYAYLIPVSKIQPSSWKNGHGLTRELAIEPPNASLTENNFLWRLSLAEVKESCDFSSFPGYNRWLTMVAGKELVLHVNAGQELAVLRPGENFSFTGADTVRCELLKGEAQDLGLIYKDGAVAAEMNTIKFTGRVRSFQLQSRTVFFYVLGGSFAISVFPGEYNFSLSAGDVLCVNPAGKEERIVLCAPEAKEASLVAVELDW